MSKHQETGTNLKGSKIEVYNGDVNKAMRKLKKRLVEDGLFQTLRAREFYESRGTKRRKAKEAAIRRFKRQRAKNADNW